VRVLLTGANGFIGSHVLDGLLESGAEATILLRTTSDTRFVERRLPAVQVQYGDVQAPGALREACRGAQVVIHCAGKTKALRKRDYFAVNADGTRNLVEACNAAGSVEQLVLISSLAVSGPGLPADPAREEEPPRPVSVYGRSKALGERHVRDLCRVPYTILRPAAVYGPRDGDLLLAFKMVKRGIMPLIGGGRQPVSLVYVGDVVEGVLRSIGAAAGIGGTYHLAHPVPWTQRALLATIAEAIGVEPRRIVVPAAVLYPLCLVRWIWSRIAARPSIMSLEKIPEYAAPGWACATDRAARDLGFVARVGLEEGVRRTLSWYEGEGWL
jgi:nucleoside-diphosphate-sugar epimerase